MAKLLSLAVLVAMFLLLIPTGLVLASQSAVPGESSYSIKRKMEDIIITIASLHPSTKAYFRVDLTNRRLEESVRLLSKKDAQLADQTLYEYASQTDAAVAEILQISDEKTKKELAKKMLEQLKEQARKIQELNAQPSLNFASITRPSPTPTLVAVQTTTTNSSGQVIVIVVTATPPPAPIRSDRILIGSGLSVTPVPEATPVPERSTQSPARGGGNAAADANAGAQETLAPIVESLLISEDVVIPTPTLRVERGGSLRLMNRSAGDLPTTTLTPAQGSPKDADFDLAGELDVPIPTPRGILTPTPYALGPDCPGFPDEYLQCLGTVVSGNNATCYTKGTVNPTRDVCYQGCGSCTAP